MITVSNVNNFSYQRQNILTKAKKISFSSMGSKLINVFGREYVIPRKVVDAADSVCLTKATFDDVIGHFTANSIIVGEDCFLTVNHLITGSNAQESGKYTINNAIKGDNANISAKRVISNQRADLCMLKFITSKLKLKASVKLAKNEPTNFEDVFIAGNHSISSKLLIIPAKLFLEKPLGSCSKNDKFQKLISPDVDCYKIKCRALEDRLNPKGLSGSAILNEKGELIGIISTADAQLGKNNLSTGNFYAIDLNTIKKFLYRSGISIGTNGSIQHEGFLSRLRQALSFRK